MSVNFYTSLGNYGNNFGRLGALETLASPVPLLSFLLTSSVLGFRGIGPLKHNNSIP